MNSLPQRPQPAPAARPDRRALPRSGAPPAYGKIACSGIEQICQVRDISARGIRVEARTMPQPGQRVWIEMPGLAACPAVVVWRDRHHGGLIFESKQDIQAVFDGRPRASLPKPRGPRFSLRGPAELSCREGTARLEAVDIAIGGLKLAGRTHLPVGTRARIKLGGLVEKLSGQVRWKNGDRLGFAFDRPMRRDDLCNILRRQ